MDDALHELVHLPHDASTPLHVGFPPHRCAPPSSMSTWAYLSSDPSRDLPRHRQRPLHRTIGRHSRRRRGRFAGIHEYSVSFANSGPANVALEATDGAAVGASEEGAARACDAAPQEQGNGCRIDRRQQDRRQQRERRRMRLRAFEDRKDAMPAVECAATEADDGDVEANVVRSAAVDARKILAQRAGQLQQRRGWQSRSSERDAAATSVKLGGDMRASDSRFMRMALRLAEKARAEGEVPVSRAPLTNIARFLQLLMPHPRLFWAPPRREHQALWHRFAPCREVVLDHRARVNAFPFYLKKHAKLLRRIGLPGDY